MKKLFLTTTTALALMLSADIVQAQQITVSGDISPTTPPTQPTWTVPGDTLIVGNTAAGTLTIANGGTVNATASTTIASGAGSTGTLNFGAPMGSAPAPTGTLNTPMVTLGAGTSTINFNHTDTLTVSARIFGLASPGIRAVNQISGTTILTSPNSYNGPTIVSGGTLKAGALGSFSVVSDMTVENT